MKGNKYYFLIPAVSVAVIVIILACGILNRTVTAISENIVMERERCIVIDPGHGGVDGGATSCTGKLESHMNLSVSLRLNDFLRVMGKRTKMIRTTDISVYTTGQTIAAKKVSDLKARVAFVNAVENATLVSIHMNHFSDSKYYGPQLFYAPTQGSEALANDLQHALNAKLVPENARVHKSADGIYLMQHINCPGILIECGFISNPEENAKLNTPAYQQKLCAIIAANLVRSEPGA